jgi:hypothetical protein
MLFSMSSWVFGFNSTSILDPLTSKPRGKNPTKKKKKEENTCREFRMGLVEFLLLASTKTHEHQQPTTREKKSEYLVYPT